MSRSIFIIAGAGWVLGILCFFLAMKIRDRNNHDWDIEDRPPKAVDVRYWHLADIGCATGISQLGAATTADVTAPSPIFSPKGEGLDHYQKQKERRERPMRLLVTYPCQPPGGVTKAERSLFGMAPATPHPRLDLDQPLLSPKRCGAS